MVMLLCQLMLHFSGVTLYVGLSLRTIGAVFSTTVPRLTSLHKGEHDLYCTYCTYYYKQVSTHVFGTS